MRNREKGVFAPSYYKNFRCTASGCRHSCCVDWEIYIDDATYEKYKQQEDILGTVEQREDGVCFKLCENGRCPNLNGIGLCNIILAHGEDYLSEICRNHPRFYNRVGTGRLEAGLGIVCEEACRLVLENEEPFSLVKVEDSPQDAAKSSNFDALPQRERIISVVEAEGGWQEKLAALKEEFSLPEVFSPQLWLQRFLSLEILDEAWERDLNFAKEGETAAQPADLSAKYYERLLTYFVYRHVSVAESDRNLRARLAFCILSVELLRFLLSQNPRADLAALLDLARRYSAEIEYSEDNLDELIFAFESMLGE